MTPTVSAIISTYNSARFLPSRLENLLTQTIAPERLEVIVINSGSEQNEEEIVHAYKHQFHALKYLRTERESLYASWNRAIALANGTYITSANTDDRLSPHALETLSSALATNSAIALVYSDFFETDSDTDIIEFRPWSEPNASWTKFEAPVYKHSELLLRCFCGAQPMWRRSVHETHGYFDDRFVTAGDYEFWLRIAEDFQFLHVQEPLGLVYKNWQGISLSNFRLCEREFAEIRKRYFAIKGGSRGLADGP